MDKDEELPKTRTDKQNKALHLWCTLMADELNNDGLDMRKVLKENVNIPWTKTTVKEYIWRPIQKALTTKISTTEIDTNEPSVIWEIINRHLGEKFGVEVPSFPSEEQTKAFIDSFKENE